MSSNLDHSLDEIIAARPRPARRGGKGSAPVAGGIRKRSQRAAAQKANVSVAPNAAKAANRATPTGPSGKATKIIVSNLPYDVNEGMIKEYFQQVVGPVRRAILTYGPNGQSRGVATVEFIKAEHAQLAAQKYNGVDVDKRPMKVELVVDPSATNFADRIGTPNKVNRLAKADKPKPVVKTAAPRAGRGATRGNKRGGAAGRSGSGRGKPKTAEQLDQDMSDYFGGDAPSTSPGAASAAATAATNSGDVGMEDTVLVGAP